MNDKVAIVTGARRGIGKAISKKLSNKGADVIVSDLDQADCEEVARDIDGLAVECDVTDPSQVKNLVERTIDKYGKVDILVNNAGIYKAKPILELEKKEWEDILNVNLTGAYNCIKETVKHMNKGNIINITSIAAEVGFGNSSAYCASKGGLQLLTKELALELAPDIRVNAVAPGTIKTPMTDFIEEDPEIKKEMLAEIPLDRMGEPEEVAQAVSFLASATYVTGEVVVVDGGWLAH